jgi:hypothetical protein
MLRSMRLRLGVLAVVSSLSGSLVLGAAAPAGAAGAANYCLSVNGVTVFQSGNALCESVQSYGTKPSIAVAVGDGAKAMAFGDNADVRAYGTHADAKVEHGSDDTAIAIGSGSAAYAAWGDHNTAVGLGTNARGGASFGSYNTAIGLGSNSNASSGGFLGSSTGESDHNTAIAHGACTAEATGGATVTCP